MKIVSENKAAMNNFWQELNPPFFALAPMEDVTDTVFREIVMSVAESDILQVLYTEFTNTDGLCNSIGYKKVSERFLVNQSELIQLKKRNTKLVAQIWGNKPQNFYESARLISDLNLFDGIDINMGCPVKKIVKKNSCSALIKSPELAKEIIQATIEGSSVPVSVKTRIGFNEVITEDWISTLLKTNISALIIHGRTQKMLSKGLADWNEIATAVELRNKLNVNIPIIGNGDVVSYADGISKVELSGVDGLMVGRGIFTNPWMFTRNNQEIEINERLDLLEQHIKLFQKTWSEKKRFNILKRFFKIYINNFSDAAILRAKLMRSDSYTEALEIIQTHRNQALQSIKQNTSEK